MLYNTTMFTWSVGYTRSPPGWNSLPAAASDSSSPPWPVYGCTWCTPTWFFPCGNMLDVTYWQTQRVVSHQILLQSITHRGIVAVLLLPSVLVVGMIHDGSTSGQFHTRHGWHGASKHSILEHTQFNFPFCSRFLVSLNTFFALHKVH